MVWGVLLTTGIQGSSTPAWREKSPWACEDCGAELNGFTFTGDRFSGEERAAGHWLQRWQQSFSGVQSATALCPVIQNVAEQSKPCNESAGDDTAGGRTAGQGFSSFFFSLP